MDVLRRGVLLVALLVVPSSARALDVHEVLRYDLFSGQPEGLPVGEPIVVVRRGYLAGLAARPGGGALILSGSVPPGTGFRLTFLTPGGIAARIDAADLGCHYPQAVAATGNGYFLTCYLTETWTTHGLWLDDEPLVVRGREEIGAVVGLSLAGGPRSGVALFYQDREGRTFARWMTVWNRPEPVLVDEGATAYFHGSITRLRNRVFGLAWVHEYEVSPDYEWQTRLTAVHAAAFRAPGLVLSERRFSPLVGTAEESTGEQRRPMVFPTAPKEQVIGWFDCSYHSSPGGLVCWEDDGLFLRERRFARPSDGILEMADISPGTQVGYTGERLVTSRLVRRAEDRWDLEVRVFTME